MPFKFLSHKTTKESIPFTVTAGFCNSKDTDTGYEEAAADPKPGAETRASASETPPPKNEQSSSKPGQGLGLMYAYNEIQANILC